jgi:type I site-specific restriction-modification system R (restriction) subunit
MIVEESLHDKTIFKVTIENKVIFWALITSVFTCSKSPEITFDFEVYDIQGEVVTSANFKESVKVCISKILENRVAKRKVAKDLHDRFYGFKKSEAQTATGPKSDPGYLGSRSPTYGEKAWDL